MDLSKEIVSDTLKLRKCDNFSQLARDIGMPENSLWYYINTKRRWYVDDWLIALNRLGACHIEGDRIVIETKVVKKLKRLFV